MSGKELLNASKGEKKQGCQLFNNKTSKMERKKNLRNCENANLGRSFSRNIKMFSSLSRDNKVTKGVHFWREKKSLVRCKRTME